MQTINKVDYHGYDEYKNRVKKLDEIKALGIDPYPHKYENTHTIKEIIGNYTDEDEIGSFDDGKEKRSDHVKVSGRIVLHRSMGKNIFASIQEEGERIQVLFNRDNTNVTSLNPEGEVSAHKFLEKKVDLGDIIGVEGHLFRTKKGEITVFASEVTLLCKSVLPLSDKHSGLVDKEARYRKRWLDMISNKEVIETFKMRSKITSLLRRYLEDAGFIGVETPILESLYGGAQAKPFTTHLNALKKDLFMRIAPELPLKKLVVGGLPKVYQIGKVFRNEGIDATHNPEFTSVEYYASYWDYKDMMQFTENLYEFLAIELFGSTKIGERKDRAGNPHEIDLKAPWIRMSMKEAVKTYGKYDVDNMSNEQMTSELRDKSEISQDKLKKANRGLLISYMFEEFAEHHLIQPHFIIDHPIETTPLCKLHRDEKVAEEGIVERFEAFILGMEACNAYSELNDPILQRKLLEDQQRLLDEGDDEAAPLDEEFIEAICQGMPPCAGNGIGIDRLVMLMADQHSIRDVIFFPMMR
ncbi:MAG: Lysine--tRNA ligase [Chlamydiia bacterium]|nr:Lysine--tRNA ligase [Chlamydiia bacterium]